MYTNRIKKEKSGSHILYKQNQDGSWTPHRFDVIKTRVYKDGDYQRQWTLPVNDDRFGLRVTIRWMDNNQNECQIALINGGGRDQNGIISRPFYVLESSKFSCRAASLLDMAGERILQVREELKRESTEKIPANIRPNTIYHRAIDRVG